jgi:hypothetical protein
MSTHVHGVFGYVQVFLGFFGCTGAKLRALYLFGGSCITWAILPALLLILTENL